MIVVLRDAFKRLPIETTSPAIRSLAEVFDAILGYARAAHKARLR